jgi:hypothetical protein
MYYRQTLTPFIKLQLWGAGVTTTGLRGTTTTGLGATTTDLLVTTIAPFGPAQPAHTPFAQTTACAAEMLDSIKNNAMSIFRRGFIVFSFFCDSYKYVI